MQIQIISENEENRRTSYIDNVQRNSSADFQSNLNSAISGVSSYSGYDGKTTSALDNIFNEAAATYNLDVNLLRAVAKQESNFDTTSTSSSGAMGIMQLMPGTAENLGCADPYDPYQNIMAGANYLRQLIDRYNGNVETALAAYNAGPTAVAEYGGVPPFEETQNYIQKVMGYYATGVTISPNVNASAISHMTETEISAQVEKLLNEFPNHESYTEFVQLLSESNSVLDSEYTDAEVAKQAMLSNANIAMKNLLANQGLN